VFRGALPLFLAAALCAAPLLARADVYRWVDEAGATHFSTSRDAIPRRFRDSAQLIPSPPATVENPSHSRPPSPPPRPPEPVQAPVAPSQGPSPGPVETPPSAPAVSGPEGNALPVPPEPGPALAPPPSRSEDPRKDEIAELEARIERDREELRKLVSMQRWDSSELASDPHVREIAERLPRLQAELAALRTEGER
jgi:hypothetical protein